VVGIYIDMKDLIKVVVENYLTEAEKTSWIETHCDNAFSNKNERYFCYAATNTFKSNFKLQDSFRTKLKEFITKNSDKISNISLKILKKDSEIAKSGFEEFKWVTENGQSLCPNIRQNMIGVYNRLLGDNFDLYVDSDGKYHIINRLDTNYSALGVMVTEYFRGRAIIELLSSRGFVGKKSWEKPVSHLIQGVLFPNVYHPNFFENDLLKNIQVGENPLQVMFMDLLTDQAPQISEKVIGTLTKVRDAGFETERKFIELLKSHGITYKNFAKDYGFVDRFLGIDLFVKLKGEWYPAQIKSSEREKILIDDLDCEGTIITYPDNKGSFMVNRYTFDRFFCKTYDACKKEEETSDVDED
jgi:hypothetical protein